MDQSKRTSWLNLVEIEIGVLHGQCLDRRIGESKRLIAEMKLLEKQLHESGARIELKFTTNHARIKFANVDPELAK